MQGKRKPDNNIGIRQAMGFQKGNSGRPKGAKNKLTLSVHQAMDYAFDACGGAERLAEWARANYGDFAKLYARSAPVRHVGADEGPIKHEHGVTIRWGNTEVPL